MTEADWLAGDNPDALLDYLSAAGRADDRRLRLFACACCRYAWPLVADVRGRRAVEAAERFADGELGAAELEAARDRALQASRLAEATVAAALRETRLPGAGPGLVVDARESHARALAAVATARAAAEPADLLESARLAAEYAARAVAFGGEGATEFWPARAEVERVQKVLCGLLRDLFGNPFRPTPFDPAWRSPEAQALARAIYHERAFERLPVLGDALVEAGCGDEMILRHCHAPAPHARGCWVVDGVLGKS